MSVKFRQASAPLESTPVDLRYDRRVDGYYVICTQCGPLSLLRELYAARGAADRHKRQVHW